MNLQQFKDRRKSYRFPIIKQIDEDAKMYLSPPLIMDPVAVTLKELSSGGMKLFTPVPIPTRFLFAVVFSAPFAQKIYAEAKIMHVTKQPDGFIVGAQFVSIKDDMKEKIENMARDYEACEIQRKDADKNYCVMSCSYKLICAKDNKKTKRKKK